MKAKSGLTKFQNCYLLRNSKIVKENLWIRDGKIVNPEEVFYVEQVDEDATVDTENYLIAPGFIDIQTNGGWGVDFSFDCDNVETGVNKVAKELLAHGVTSFCPTMVTSDKETYLKILPKIQKKQGGKHGATVLGVHLEGPFINSSKKGAHADEYIKNPEKVPGRDTYPPALQLLEKAHKSAYYRIVVRSQSGASVGSCIPYTVPETFVKKGINSIIEIYGSLENVNIVTLAPELPGALDAITGLTKMGIKVALGHSAASLAQGEEAVQCGANLITHLFNAMLPFHHRDPGLVGLLASTMEKQVYYGIISDGLHTHPAALRIACRTNPKGLVLVSDAIAAQGLADGRYRIGPQAVTVEDGCAYITGTKVLCGSTTGLDQCVKTFKHSTDCSLEYALETASLHPAKALGIEHQKGTLDFGSDADFVVLHPETLKVSSTWIAGECVYKNSKQT